MPTSIGSISYRLTLLVFHKGVSHERDLEKKQAALFSILKEMDSVLVAYSGGVDSSFLMWAAVQALGAEKVTAATAKSPIYVE